MLLPPPPPHRTPLVLLLVPLCVPSGIHRPPPARAPRSRGLIPRVSEAGRFPSQRSARTRHCPAGPAAGRGRLPRAARRSAQARHRPAARAPGLSPLTQRKRCPYMGRFGPVTRRRSPGRFRESPPPRAAGQGRGAGKGAGIFPGRAARGARKAPGPAAERPRWAGCAPGPPIPGPALARLSPTPRCLGPASVQTPLPSPSARQEGRRPPASFPCRVPGLVLPGRLLGPPGAAAALTSLLPPPAAGWGCTPTGSLASFGAGRPQEGMRIRPLDPLLYKTTGHHQALETAWTQAVSRMLAQPVCLQPHPTPPPRWWQVEEKNRSSF